MPLTAQTAIGRTENKNGCSLISDDNFSDRLHVVKRFLSFDVQDTADCSQVSTARIMQDAIPVEPVGAAQMGDVAVEHFTVGFIEGHPFLDHRLGVITVEEARTAIAG